MLVAIFKSEAKIGQVASDYGTLCRHARCCTFFAIDKQAVARYNIARGSAFAAVRVKLKHALANGTTQARGRDCAKNWTSMRVLIWHVDSFVCRITEKGRSPIVEPMGEREMRVGEALLVLASVEESDERAPESVAQRAAAMLSEHARKLKVNMIVLHSFAHLFAELAKPEIAVDVLKETAKLLSADGFSVARTPFGWFNELEIKAKGHPLSRLARTISAED